MLLVNKTENKINKILIESDMFLISIEPKKQISTHTENINFKVLGLVIDTIRLERMKALKLSNQNVINTIQKLALRSLK